MTQLKDSRISTHDFERLEITVKGTRQVLYTAGNGRPLLYFHGASTFHGFDFARDWLKDFRVYIPYHPGFAESADAPHLISTLDYVAHYKELLDALRLDKIHLVGCSLGGRLAAEFALTHPEHIESLVLLCPAGLDCPEAPMTNLSAISPQDLPSYLIEDVSILAPFLPTTDDPEFAALRARESVTVGKLTRHGFRSPLVNSTQEHLPAATLLIWGTKDRVLPVEQADAWQQKFPGIEIELLEAVGHLLLDESKASCRLVAAFCLHHQSN